MRADGSPRTRPAGEPRRPECRPAWSRSRRGRAAPGSCAGRRRPPAGGWRSCGAGECGETPPASAASRTQSPRRRVTSELERRRPLLERKSARSRGSAGERVAAALQVAPQGPLGGLADRQQPLLGALAEHPQLLGLEVERADVEVDDLLAAQAAGVGELEHRPVAQLQRRASRDPLQQRRAPARRESTRGSFSLALRAGDEVGGVLADPLGADEEVEEAADRRQLAGDGRRRRARRGERRPRSGARRGGGRRRAEPAPPPTRRTGRGRRRRRVRVRSADAARPSGRGHTRPAPPPRSSGLRFAAPARVPRACR